MRTLSAAIALVALLSFPIPASEGDVAVASEGTPAALSGFELPDDAEAFVLGADGRTLAHARWIGGPKDQSEIVHRGDETTSVRVRGRIRDLLLLDDGRLLGLLYRPAKKWEGDSYLISWTPGDKKAERLMRVPPSAADLDRWNGRDAIVLACKNEIRSFLLPDLRSGPVFMFPGDNRALTTLGAGPYLWVGQDAGLYLIDLEAPSGREAMAVVAQQAVPSPVAQLAAYDDASTALVRLDDDRLYRATLDPPGFEAAGSASHVAGLAKGSSRPPIARPEPAPVVAEIVEPAQEVPEKVEPEPVVAEVVEPAQEVPEKVEPEPVVVEPVAVAQAESAKSEPAPEVTTPAVEPEPTAETEPAKAEAPIVEPEATTPKAAEAEAVVETEPAQTSTHQLSGRLSGRLDLVREVVLRGPNNIILEAARVRPDAEGRWGIDGLAPGRYRVQVDGGGARVLVVEPSLVLVEVGDAAVTAPEIKILRAF